MEMRQIGHTGIEVSRLGLGCATFGREIDEATSFQIMDSALGQGITFFDTAEAYGGGQARRYRYNQLGVNDVREVGGEMHSSERILGRWIKSRGVKSRIVVQTKVSANGTESEVRAALDASLHRLQVDHIDFYLFHNYDPKIPLEDGLAAFEQGIHAGKIRFGGCSNFSVDQILSGLEIHQSNGLPRLEVVQPIYNIVCREIEEALLPLCQKEEVGVVTYSPLGAGFLTGKYSPDEGSIPKGTRFDVIPGHVDIYFRERSFRIVEKLRDKSKQTGISMVKLAMGWVLQRSGISSILIGARNEGHLQNALTALEMNYPREWVKEINDWYSN